MKKKIKSLTVSILLTLLLPSLSMADSIKITNDLISSRAEGNGEVLSKKNHFKDINDFKIDMKNLYSKTSVGLKFIEKTLKAINGRSGDGYTTKEDINITTSNYLIIHAKLAKGEYPIYSNLTDIEPIQDEKEFTIHIPISKVIKNKIIIYNKKGEILIEYNIIK